MKTYPLNNIVATASVLSPFYKKLYQKLNIDKQIDLSNLPLVNQDEFWRQNTINNNQLLTEEPSDGIVFKSGGTTGNPKFSVYSKMEWETMCGTFGQYLVNNGINDGDRVANLFYAGELYSSFLFLHDSIERCPANCMLFPISGAASMEFIVHTLIDFKINTLLAVPTTIMALADYIHANNIEGLKVEKIYFGGETMYLDQRKRLSDILKLTQIHSVGYASVDAGLLGFADSTCGFNEHRVFDGYNILEIIDEKTGKPIIEEGVEGKLYTTNLSRLIMPIIRYPVGDNALWTSPPDTKHRKFRILGRSEEGARIGPVSFYYEDLQKILLVFNEDLPISGYQMIIDHINGKDKLTIKIGVEKIPDKIDIWSKRILDRIIDERPAFHEEEENGKVHPIAFEWVHSEELDTNPRTGKLMRIIDNRF